MSKKVKESSNLFLNIRDVRNNFIYTIDDKVISIIKIFPKNCKLMSKSEKLSHATSLTQNFSSELKPFKLYFTNRPVDLQKNQDYQANLMDRETNSDKFALLNKRSKSFGILSTTGKALESEAYIEIFETNHEYAEQELIKRLNDIQMKFTNSGYKTEVLEESSIIQLIQGYTNPSVAYLEDQNYLEEPLKINI